MIVLNALIIIFFYYKMQTSEKHSNRSIKVQILQNRRSMHLSNIIQRQNGVIYNIETFNANTHMAEEEEKKHSHNKYKRLNEQEQKNTASEQVFFLMPREQVKRNGITTELRKLK